MSDYGEMGINRLVAPVCALPSLNPDVTDRLKELTGVDVKPYVPSIPAANKRKVGIQQVEVRSARDMHVLMSYFAGTRYRETFEEISTRLLVSAEVRVPVAKREDARLVTGVPTEIYATGKVARDFLNIHGSNYKKA